MSKRRQPDVPPTLIVCKDVGPIVYDERPAEEIAVAEAVAIADRIGYGNLIERLLLAWEKKEEAARRANGWPECPHFALRRKVAMGDAAQDILYSIDERKGTE